MSLFSKEEICEGCIFAVWVDGNVFYDKQPRFARCLESHESSANGCSGECNYKTRDSNQPTKIITIQNKILTEQEKDRADNKPCN